MPNTDDRLSSPRGMAATLDAVAELGWGLTEYPLKHAIELGQRLKANFIGHFADATIWVQ